MFEWLLLRFLIPFLPAVLDYGMRSIMLSESSALWQLIDLKALATSGAFFCLLISIECRLDTAIASDIEYQRGFRVFKSNMIVCGLILAFMFGVVTLSEYECVRNPMSDLSKLILPVSLKILISVIIFSLALAIFGNIRYKLRF
jgi:hypothetical protein